MWNKFRLTKSLTAAIFFLLPNAPCMTQIPNAGSHQSIEIRKMIQQAEDLFDAALFAEAIPIYQEILHAIENGIYPVALEKSLRDKINSEIRFRLAQALFQVKDYKSAVALLQDHHAPADHQFLLGTAYRNNGEYDQAIAVFQSYLINIPQDSVTHHDEVHFELALAFYFKGDLSKAQDALENVRKSSLNHRLQILSNFYLARIKIAQGSLDEAEQYLNQTDPILTNDDLLKYELAFLRGVVYYKSQNFEKAAFYFEKAIPQQNSGHAKWHEDTLYYLGLSYLKLADLSTIHNEQKQKEYFAKSEQALTKLVEIKPQETHARLEHTWLTLGECYLRMGKRLKDENNLKKAESIFSDTSKFPSQESLNQTFLFKAQCHPTYTERDRRFRQLTQQINANSPFYARAWYFRGLNDFEEGHSLEQGQKYDEARKIFERAAVALEKASELLKISHPDIGAQAILLQARAYNAQQTEKDRQKALNTLDKIWEDNSTLLHSLSDPLEAYILYGHIAAQNYPMAISKLQQGIEKFPKSRCRPQALNLLGILFYKNGSFDIAEETFQQLAKEWPQSPLAAEALFRASQSAEKLQKDRSLIRSYRQKILQQYPSSSIAPEAYFTLFSYQEYLQGDRTAIKHLNVFPELYPDSPFVLNALFLIGLDNKRDRRSPEGKWLRKKNLTGAIDNFQDVESTFETLFSKKKIPIDHIAHYLLIRYRAHMERGLANYILANESAGAKKQIYLEYAQEALQQLLLELHSDDDPYKQWIVNQEPFWHLEEESAYWLSQAYIAANDYEKGEKLLSSMLEKYESAKITRGYFLSRTWSNQATIALSRQEYAHALECLLRAEDCAKGKVLSTDQRLSLLIQQSMCLKELNQLDKAILILSKVVNDDAASSLRVKAMFLRAEIYEKQERYELARKQLEATSKKGGEWALKAKEKLEKEYGYR